jgi:CheY-like chemotaxis protein
LPGSAAPGGAADSGNVRNREEVEVGRKKILLTDDVELLRGLEKTFFRRRNFHLLVAQNGQQALEMVRADVPDLVFIDLDMPELAGDVFCRLLKSDPLLASIPVVIVAPDGGGDTLARCYRSGCDEVIRRPIDRQELVALTRRILDVSSRATSRVRASLRVFCGRDQDELSAGTTLTLGTGGALIVAVPLLPVNSDVFLEFVLPGTGRLIACRGRVVWVSRRMPGIQAVVPQDEMGVEFLGLTAEDKEGIRVYLEREGLDSCS